MTDDTHPPGDPVVPDAPHAPHAPRAPVVSVVIPVYNRADSIRRAIHSVLAQTLADFELIVVDDASTDATIAVVEAIGDARIRVLRHDQNRRAAAARNTGIRAARAHWIAFLDSDDTWRADKLARQLAHLEQAPDSMRASCTGYRIIAPEATFAKVPQLLTHQDIFMGCDLGPGSTLMVRRDVYDHIGFNVETFLRYEDWDWVLRYTAHYTMGLLPQPLTDVYRGAEASAAAIIPATEEWIAIHNTALAQFGPRFRRKVLALRWLEVAQHCFRDGQRRTGLHYLWRGLKSHPWVRPSMYLILFDTLFGTGLQRAIWRVRGWFQ